MNNKNKKVLLLISVLIFLVTSGIIVALLYPFPSKEEVHYFDEETPIIYQNEVVEEERVRSFNQQPYVPFSFIKEKLDPNIMYDEESESVIITMPKDVYQLPTDELKYFMNQKEYSLHFPVTKSENNEPWIAVEWLEQVYPVYLHMTEHSLFVYENGSTRKVAEVKPDLEDYETKVRQKPTVTSPYYINLEPGDKVYIQEEQPKFYRILTKNGVMGYLPKASVGDWKPETLKGKTKEQVPEDVSEIEAPFHLTWDAIYHPDATPSEVKARAGVDVISPTWFSLIDEKGSIENFAKREYVSSAHENGDQVWALFSNGFDPDLTKEVLSSFEKRQYVIRQLLDFSRIYQLDGINIDFENVYMEDGRLLTQFVRELTPLAHEAGLVVSVDVAFPYGSEMWSRFLEHQKLAEASDYVMVMAYDEHWANSKDPGSVASLPWVRRNMDNLLELVPSDKLLLGVPLYTRLWTETTRENGEVEVSSESLSMEEAREWMAEKNVQPTYDEVIGQNVVTYENENKKYYIWLEDERSLENRIHLMKELDLAGIATWSTSFADSEAWKKINKDLHE